MAIRHAPITDQPTIQPTITVIIAQVGIGGMSRTPRPPNSTWPGPPAPAARQARGPELIQGDAHDDALAVDEVRDHVGREDAGSR